MRGRLFLIDIVVMALSLLGAIYFTGLRNSFGTRIAEAVLVEKRPVDSRTWCERTVDIRGANPSVI